MGNTIKYNTAAIIIIIKKFPDSKPLRPDIAPLTTEPAAPSPELAISPAPVITAPPALATALPEESITPEAASPPALITPATASPKSPISPDDEIVFLSTLCFDKLEIVLSILFIYVDAILLEIAVIVELSIVLFTDILCLMSLISINVGQKPSAPSELLPVICDKI